MREIGEDFVQRLKNSSFCHGHVRRNLEDFQTKSKYAKWQEQKFNGKKKFKQSMA
jgi:hypothetical protein